MKELRENIAKIIFIRLSAQISGIHVTDQYWNAAYNGWVENPSLFPLVEASFDIAEEILHEIKNEI